MKNNIEVINLNTSQKIRKETQLVSKTASIKTSEYKYSIIIFYSLPQLLRHFYLIIKYFSDDAMTLI